MIGFVGFVLLVVVGIHLYLWKRLVRDTTRPGRWRKLGGVAMIVLAVLIPATLIGVRGGYVQWLAWPGYLWLAVMFYLLVTLVALEIPRLVVSLVWRARDRSAKGDGRAAQPVRGTGMGTAAGSRATSTAESNAGAINTAESNASAISTAEINAGAISTAERNAGAAGTVGSGASSVRSAGHLDDAPSTAVSSMTGAGGAAAGSRAGLDTSNPGSATPSNPGSATPSNPGSATPTKPASATPSGPDGVTPSDPDGATPNDPNAASAPNGAARPGPDTGSADAEEKPGIERRLLLARGAAIFAGLTAAGVTGYGVKTALGGPQLDRVQIPIAKLSRAMDGTRLAVVSDIHLGPLTGSQHMSRIVSMINSVDADVVCIVGDMVDGTVAELGRFAEPLREIRSRQGAYFVTGNHEYYSGFQQWVDEVARLGVRPLRNERLEIRTRGGVFDLAGVNDVGGTEFDDAPDFARALGDRDTARPVVLMAHQPVMARDAARYGVDLQVSGHTHGGQMVPFNLLVQLEQPVVSGYGEVDGVPVYVTNGAGFWGPPVRVGAPPQVTLVELRTP